MGLKKGGIRDYIVSKNNCIEALLKNSGEIWRNFLMVLDIISLRI